MNYFFLIGLFILNQVVYGQNYNEQNDTMQNGSIKSFPWILSLVSIENNTTRFCSAIIVSDKYAITTDRCASLAKQKSSKIYAGRDSLTGKEMMNEGLRIKSIKVQNSSIAQNHIALIEFSKSFPFNDETVKKACFFQTEDETENNIAIRYGNLTGLNWRYKNNSLLLNKFNYSDASFKLFQRINLIEAEGSIRPDDASPLHFEFIDSGKFVTYVVGVFNSNDSIHNNEKVAKRFHFTRLSFHLNWIVKEVDQKICIKSITYM